MNPLTNILTPKLRGYLYAAYALAGIILGALTIADVHTGKTADVLAYIGVALGATAASNASPTPVAGKHQAEQAGAVDVVTILLIAVLVVVLLILLGGVR